MPAVTCFDAANFLKVQDKELQDAKAELAKVIEQNDGYAAAIKEAEDKLGFHIDSLDALNAQHDALNAEMNNMKGCHDAVNKAIADEQAAHGDTKMKFTQQKLAASRALEAKAGGLQGLKDQLTSLTDQYNTLKSQHAGLNSGIGKNQAAIAAKHDALEAHNKAVAALDFVNSHKAELQAACEKMKNDIVMVNGKAEAFASNHAKIAQEMQDLKNGTATAAEKADLARRLAAEKLAIQNDSSLSAQEKLDMLKADNMEAAADNAAMQAGLDAHMAHIAGHGESYDALKADVEALFTKYTTALSQNTSMNNYLKGLTGQMNLMKDTFNN